MRLDFSLPACISDPLLRQESYSYDLNGNLTGFTDRKGQATAFSYDRLDRRTLASFAGGATIGYSYDAGHRLTQAVDSVSGTITLAHDNLDQLTSETTPQGNVSCTYDAGGRRTGMTVAGQTAVGYGYDNASRLTSVTQGGASVSIAYDNANRRTSLTLPNGIGLTYAYDTASQLTGLTYQQGGTTLGALEYGYDKAGRRIYMDGSYARTGLPAALTSASYDAANQLTAWGAATLTYDANGNLTGDGTNTYSWNARDQLTDVSGGATASFGYDAFGRRYRKTVTGATTDYLHDGANPVQELSGGSPVANLLTGLGVDEYFTRTDAAGARHFLPDALGGTLALSDPAGAVQTQYTYEPFGKTTSTGSTSANPFQFTGRENDGTGLYYYRARYYNPTLQRFISQDPIGFAGGDVNLYGYVGNNPVDVVDPSGEIGAAGCGIGALVGGGVYTALVLSGRKFSPLEAVGSVGGGCVAGSGVSLLVAAVGAGPGAAAAAGGAAAGAASVSQGPRVA